MTARIFITLFTLLALFACSEDKSVNPGPAPTAGAGKTLAKASFADQDLARVVRWALKKPRGATITTDELATLTRLRADEQGITNLTGIQHCINLDTLLLWGNDITDIQPLAGLTKLERLDLGANEIADARPLEGLVNLTHLSLWGNQVTDIQPLTKLTKLEKLSLWGNGITDVRPLAKLTRLTQLQLGENELTDVSALDGLTRLNWLGLVGNPLSDSALRQQIPTLMQEGVLISVRYPGPSSPVTVEDEPEPEPTPEPEQPEPEPEQPEPEPEQPEPEPEQPEPEQPEPSDDRAVLLAFYAATGGGSAWTGDNWDSDEPIGTWQGVTTDDEGRVIRLELFELGLSGAIPPELAQLTNLRYLDLYNNQLSGAIPPELGRLTNLRYLDLFGNQLSGAIPAELAQLTNLQSLNLANNNFSGCIPASLQTIQTNDLDALGLSPCDTSGQPPSGHSADRAVLLAFYAATGGGSAWTGDNWDSDEPIGTWQGVTTDEEGRVIRLELSGLGLTGAIPAELAQLTNLQLLYLGNNNLSGCIPASLQTIQTNDLDRLGLSPCDASGQPPSGHPADRAVLLDFYAATGGGSAWTGDNWGSDEPISTWQGVTLDEEGRVIRLWLFNLGLTGAIPPELGQLTNLQTLGLFLNQLTGAIPSELGQLSNLEFLALDINQLTGAIPTELGQLTNLQTLGLRRNQLTGAIPPELGQLTNLQELYLGGNNFSGCIPAGLQEIETNDLDQLELSPCG